MNRSLLVICTAIAVFLAVPASYAQVIGPDDIQRNAVRSKHIKKSGVRSSDIKNETIQSKDLRDESVTTEKIATGAVSTAKLQNEAVNATKIESGAVGTAELADGAVTTAKLAPQLQGGPDVVVRTFLANTAGNNTLGEAEASCDAGEQLIGGGGGWVNTTVPATSYKLTGTVSDNGPSNGSDQPIADGATPQFWHVSGKNTTGADARMLAYAICLQP
jgi:hypothetical protein